MDTRRSVGPARLAAGLLLIAFGAGCSSDRNSSTGPGSHPDAPRNFSAHYYDHAVLLSWELGPAWNAEPFAVYGRRVSDSDFFRIAEVTSCTDGRCVYRDVNVVPNVTYRYFVAAVGGGGRETSSAATHEVHVPNPVPPPVPGSVDAVALDDAIYLRWGDHSRAAGDFSFYRVYLEGGDGTTFLLGETDSEGFLDLLVENGSTYSYFVTAVDDQGHESEGSLLSSATPRPDFHGELLYAYQDQPSLSGFRFQDSEAADPVLPGDDLDHDFRIEFDQDGWWLRPGPDAQVYQDPIFTTALRCGPAADAGCTDVRQAPQFGYVDSPIQLLTEHAYVIKVHDPDGARYGLVRITHLGMVQDGAIAIFDWAFQLQADNLQLIVVE